MTNLTPADYQKFLEYFKRNFPNLYFKFPQPFPYSFLSYPRVAKPPSLPEEDYNLFLKIEFEWLDENGFNSIPGKIWLLTLKNGGSYHIAPDAIIKLDPIDDRRTRVLYNNGVEQIEIEVEATIEEINNKVSKVKQEETRFDPL